MKKLILILPLALGLAACNPADVIKQVQADAKLACGFVPAASMIVAIFNAGVGQSAEQIASLICQGVNNLPTARAARRGVVGAPSIVVNGQRILVQGHFER